MVIMHTYIMYVLQWNVFCINEYDMLNDTRMQVLLYSLSNSNRTKKSLTVDNMTCEIWNTWTFIQLLYMYLFTGTRN